MLHYVVLFICVLCTSCRDEVENIDLDFVASLRDDANLDLSTDKEYEDLRAELLASHTVLANLVDKDEEELQEYNENARRYLTNTACWNLSGICVDSNLCTGYNYLTQVPGCKDKLKVCCFNWNKFHVRDMREFGLSNLAMPWSMQESFGSGGGIVEIDTKLRKTKKPRKPRKLKNKNNTEPLIDEPLALLLRLKK